MKRCRHIRTEQDFWATPPCHSTILISGHLHLTQYPVLREIRLQRLQRKRFPNPVPRQGTQGPLPLLFWPVPLHATHLGLGTLTIRAPLHPNLR